MPQTPLRSGAMKRESIFAFMKRESMFMFSLCLCDTNDALVVDYGPWLLDAIALRAGQLDFVRENEATAAPGTVIYFFGRPSFLTSSPPPNSPILLQVKSCLQNGRRADKFGLRNSSLGPPSWRCSI